MQLSDLHMHWVVVIMSSLIYTLISSQAFSGVPYKGSDRQQLLSQTLVTPFSFTVRLSGLVAWLVGLQVVNWFVGLGTILWALFFKVIYFISCVEVFCLHLRLCTMCVPCILSDQRRHWILWNWGTLCPSGLPASWLASELCRVELLLPCQPSPPAASCHKSPYPRKSKLQKFIINQSGLYINKFSIHKMPTH